MSYGGGYGSRNGGSNGYSNGYENSGYSGQGNAYNYDYSSYYAQG